MSDARNIHVLLRGRSGGLLVEVIIAMALGIIFAVAIVKMGLGTFESVRQSRDQLIAMHYASDGIEAIRTIARQNFSNLSEGTHGVAFGTSYSLSGTENTYGKFTRTLTLSPVYRNASNEAILNPANPQAIIDAGGWKDIQSFVVDSEVSWDEAARTRNIALKFVVSKWFTYPLQEVLVGSGGLYHGTQWTENAITLALQPTFNPPTQIGMISAPASETIVKMLVDAPRDHLIMFTQEGTVILYSLETEETGTLFEIGTTTLSASISDAVIIGDYLYVSSSSDNSEISVLNADDISLVRTWNLPGAGDVLSVASSNNNEWLVVGRKQGETGTASGDILLITPDPSLTLPIKWQKDTGFDVVSIVPYTSEWLIYASDRTNEELGILSIPNMNKSSCNLQGAQLISDIGIMGDTIIFSKRSGVNDTLSAYTMNPADPTLCTTYDAPIWSNGIAGTDMEDIYVDLFEARIYSLTDELNLQFHFNDISPSTVTKHTVIANTLCTEIAGDESLLFVSCTGAGTDFIVLLQGGGVDRLGYVSSGTYISSVLNGGSKADWRAIYWNGSGGILRLKIRTAEDEELLPLAEWVGPGGSTGAYFTVSGSAVEAFPSASGTQYMQIKAWLGHTGATIPILRSVILLLK